jgi:hypothetical protein
LSKQYKGRKIGELVLYHVKLQPINKINDAISTLHKNIHPSLIETTDKFLYTILYSFSKSKIFWKTDCGETLKIYTNSTKVEAKKFNLEIDDDYAFDVFNLIVLLLAREAYQDPNFKKFIKRSIKIFGIFSIPTYYPKPSKDT